MGYREPFATGEWYHCFNRGVDKRVVFTCDDDYERFLQLCYLTNDSTAAHRSDLSRQSTSGVLRQPRTSPLVRIGAFCLMPNHFHLLMQPIDENGITSFMRRLMTAYTMYFNIRYERTGNLFAKPFKSRHVHDDAYFQRVIRYIHCNPADLYEPDWKSGRVKDKNALAAQLIDFRYSSLDAYLGRTELASIIDEAVFNAYVPVPIQESIEEAMRYHQDLEIGKVTP